MSTIFLTSLITEKSDELEIEIVGLQKILTGQQEEAKQAIALWEERCSMLEDQVNNPDDAKKLEECKIQLSILQEDICAKDAILAETKTDLQVEKDNLEVLSKEKLEAEEVFKSHIGELEVAISEHIRANEELQGELESKEDALFQTEQQVQVLTKELVDNGAQSEEVVSQWQGKSHIGFGMVDCLPCASECVLNLL